MSLDANDTSKLIDELSLSILRGASPSKKHNEKRLQDAFRRRVKRHNNARTNQFEVVERLNGLEEKFQILTLDNLSDALHQRRRELREFEYSWLPDILDFFLHLAGDPARNENLLRVYRVPPRIGTPPPLRWKDVLADDPIDLNDRLWRVPDFRNTDDSGYEDDEDDLIASVEVSPSSKRDEPRVEDSQALREAILQPSQRVSDDTVVRRAAQLHETNQISEIVLIREILFIFRGYPSRILRKKGTGYELERDVVAYGISQGVLTPLVSQIAQLRQGVDRVHSWIMEEHEFAYVEAMQGAAESVLNSLHSQVDSLQHSLLLPFPMRTASIIRVLHEVTKMSVDVLTIAEFLEQTDRGDAISYLDTLLAVVGAKQACNDDGGYKVLLGILEPSLRVYLEPCWRWLREGEIEASNDSFFVRFEAGEAKSSRLWHDRYALTTEGSSRPTQMISCLAPRILTCGKTAAFIRHLSNNDDHVMGNAPAALFTKQILQSAHVNVELPFNEAFLHAFSEDVDSLLERHTQKLKALLDTRCGVNQTLDAIDQIFLGRNMTILGEIEAKIFDRIDRCVDAWNDRFEIRDMLEAAFSADNSAYTIDAMSIHSTFTSSRTMQSRRSSVKILSALSYGYRLSWPLSNIIDQDSVLIYRRIALMLTQIRRARYCLQYQGYPSVVASPIDNEASPADQTFAQILASTLLDFINALYDCLTVSITQPLGRAMRRDMEEALTVDDMIHAHKDYISRLGCAYLVGAKLRLLQQSLVAILDLCIQLSDLVSNTVKATSAESDGEVGSFTSALSRRRTAHNNVFGSDEESDEGGLADGYSSFIVLEDDTSVIKELRKVRIQYQRQLKFFIAGLKGVGKAGQHVQDLVTLADRLALCQHD